MAGPRRKPQRKSGGRKKRASGGSASIWLWSVALVAIVGGIAAYDNSAAVRRFADGLTDSGTNRVQEKVATKAQPKSTENKPSASATRGPVPPRDVAGRDSQTKRSAEQQRPDTLRTAGIVPPAPVGRPGVSSPSGVTQAAIRPDRPAIDNGRYRAKFYLCGTAKQDDCVATANSFVLKGEKIRLVGIEVPDIRKPRCEAERIKASDAKLRVRAFLDSGPFDVTAAHAGDEDSSGQKIRAVTRNGVSLSDILVREGLARRPGASGSWC